MQKIHISYEKIKNIMKNGINLKFLKKKIL